MSLHELLSFTVRTCMYNFESPELLFLVVPPPKPLFVFVPSPELRRRFHHLSSDAGGFYS
ncbi:hypothetical protein IGI04_019114 [Brassica rapa subsp. trilocularis]|uniref:Uncharacterized protein n=1 Tax=Brassica rapa subsp. trilocularis TaxID=1813537 RepID=A0ABQ7MHA3_BRACM|nr:hypothetical protein IGI04_019114 [Brassica rapa subsp. trilocularis]